MSATVESLPTTSTPVLHKPAHYKATKKSPKSGGYALPTPLSTAASPPSPPASPAFFDGQATPKAASRGAAGWNSHGGAVCKDGSLDMRHSVNGQGEDKWPTKLDGTPDMRFSVNKLAAAEKASKKAASRAVKPGRSWRRSRTELTTQLFADLPDNTEVRPEEIVEAQWLEDTCTCTPASRTASITKALSVVATFAKAASAKVGGSKWNAHSGPVCKDGSLDMRAAANKGEEKWPKCADGSYDMRFKINRGKSKTKSKSKAGAEGTLEEGLAI